MMRGIALLALLLVTLAACTGNSGGRGEVATARTGPPTAPPSRPAALDPEQRHALFRECMLAQGFRIASAPPSGSWGNLVDDDGYRPEGRDTELEAALDECERQLPPVAPPEPVSAETLAQYRRYAQCMRDQGVADFPDPGPNGELTGAWLRENRPAAVRACEPLLPNGGR
jgi:hypothetical protein